MKCANLNGVLMAQGSSFGFGASHAINCPPGSYCDTAIPLTTYGTYYGVFDNSWYTYVATVTDNCTILPAVVSTQVLVNPLPDVNFIAIPSEGCAPLTVSLHQALPSPKSHW